MIAMDGLFELIVRRDRFTCGVPLTRFKDVCYDLATAFEYQAGENVVKAGLSAVGSGNVAVKWAGVVAWRWSGRWAAVL